MVFLRMEKPWKTMKNIAFTLQIAFELGQFPETIESANAQSSGNVQQLHLLCLVGKKSSPSPILSWWVPVLTLFEAWWKWKNQVENYVQGCYFPDPRLFTWRNETTSREYDHEKHHQRRCRFRKFEASPRKNVSVEELLHNTLLRRGPMVSNHSLSNYTYLLWILGFQLSWPEGILHPSEKRSKCNILNI